MKLRLLELTALIALPALSACQTVSSQAPSEFKAAEESLKAADSAGVDHYMPSAYEAAQRKFAASLDMLDDAGSYQDKGDAAQAEHTRAEAIKLANESKAISDGGVALVKDMHSFDGNSFQFLSVAQQAQKAQDLQNQLAQAKGDNAKLQGELTALQSENKNLANRPVEVEQTIPADFRIGKPVAYFSTGSTTLNAKYRPDIEDLATMLKNNKDLEVKLEGYADPRGSAQLNKQLADRRLQAVADELKKQGVEPERVKTEAIGATNDRVTTTARGELQLDRKVTATITKISH